MDEFWDRQKRVLLHSYVNSFFVILNIVIFVIQLVLGEEIYKQFALDSFIVANGKEYYRLVTSMFMHASLEHIFSNMLILVFVGAGVEHDIGHAEYFVLYMFSGIAGNIVSVLYDMKTYAFKYSIGASGAVFGVIGAVIVIALFGRKNLKNPKSFLIRLGLMVAVSVYSSFSDPAVDNAAHVGGLLFGAVLTVFITLIFMKQYTMEEWL